MQVVIAPTREVFPRCAILETLVVYEPADADSFNLLDGIGGEGWRGRDGAKRGECSKYDSQGAIYG